MTKTKRIAICAALVAAAFSSGGCNKDGKDTGGSAQKPALDPREHAPREIEPSLGAGAAQPADPHGGGAGATAPNPHSSGGAMGEKAGKTLEKAADGRVVLGPVTLAVPGSWQERPTKSGMRAAEWAIPGKASGAEADLVVYYFGQGGAGSAEANLERWYQQFEQADGKPSADKAVVDKKRVSDMPVTFVEVGGRYVAAVQPGSTDKHDQPDSMMLAAIVETQSGPYYFKLVGPKATVTAVKKEFRAAIESMVPKP